tara:strand:+ start:6448 stop:6852 length:405 start_codon:yes stop_codon:yes gene_type:complete
MKDFDLTKFKAIDIKTLPELYRLLSQNHVTLDVRSFEEYCSGHLCGAQHVPVPLPPLSKNDIDEFQLNLGKVCARNRNQLILVYCKVGKRAGLAKVMLMNMGYRNVVSLGGVKDGPLSKLKGGNKKAMMCKCMN